MGENEDTCMPEQSEIARQQMGDMMQVFKFYPGVGHGDFITVNTPEYFKDLLDFLSPDFKPAASTYLQ